MAFDTTSYIIGRKKGIVMGTGVIILDGETDLIFTDEDSDGNIVIEEG